MNRYQRLVLAVAIIDLIVILLFPPFIERSLAKSAFTTFDGFYFLLPTIAERSVEGALLSLEILWIVANALSAWLLLNQAPTRQTPPNYTLAIGIFTVVNLAIICLFPPFEQYNSWFRTTAPGFDSFYFIFGDRSARPLFMPLLQLEIFFVLINALALYLLFNAVTRSKRAEQQRADIARMGAARTDAPALSIENTMQEKQRQAEQRRADLIASLGRKHERRKQNDPAYRGRERRRNPDRRHHP